jgi:hypothetical protein
VTTPEEKHEFNEAQKRYRENEHLHKYTTGRDHRELMEELKKVNNSLGFLIDTLLKYLEDEEKRRGEEHRRSTYGMYDPFKHRTQRGHEDDRWAGWAEDKYREPYRNPFKQRPNWDTPPPYAPDEDTDPDKDSAA